jgi:hypothetical protein
MQPKVQEYCSTAGLKYRGWTDKAIELFLKAPDKTAPNPHYRSAAPVKLYLITRVEVAENSEPYQTFVKSNEARKTGSAKAVLTKKEKLLKYVQDCPIYVKHREYASVTKGAIIAYNNFKQSLIDEGRDIDFESASMNSDKAFLERITVNHLRHQFSGYEAKLETLFGKVGTKEAYEILNKRIYFEIAQAYPMLKDECERQLARKFDEAYSEVQT